LRKFAVSALRAEPVRSTMVARRTYAALPPSSDALESTREGGDWTPSWTVRAR